MSVDPAYDFGFQSRLIENTAQAIAQQPDKEAIGKIADSVSKCLRHIHSWRLLQEREYIQKLDELDRLVEMNTKSIFRALKPIPLNTLADVACEIRSLGMHVQYLPRELFDKENVIAAANKHHSDSAQFATPRLKESRPFILRLVEDNGGALQHVDKKYRGDFEVLAIALKQSQSFYYLASDDLKLKVEFQKLVTYEDCREGLRSDVKKILEAKKISLQDYLAQNPDANLLMGVAK